MTDGNYLDHLILKALRKDDEKALSHLFESQYNRLFRSGLKLGADTEVVKESIQAIFKVRAYLKPNLPAWTAFIAACIGS